MAWHKPSQYIFLFFFLFNFFLSNPEFQNSSSQDHRSYSGCVYDNGVKQPMAVRCKMIFNKCPKILYTKVSVKMAYANSTDSDKVQSDQGLLCLPFH